MLSVILGFKKQTVKYQSNFFLFYYTTLHQR